MADEREIRCRHCDARYSLVGWTDAKVDVRVGDGVPHYDLVLDGSPVDVVLSCDICDNEGTWSEMGYIYYPGITHTEKEAQREPWA